MEIRAYRPDDCIPVMQLFFEIVRTANAEAYPLAQLEQWANADTDTDTWAKSLSENYTVVAEENGRLIGFGDIVSNGYFNRLFVHPDFQRWGIASRMADELEKTAEKNAIGVVFTQLTDPSRPFFAKRGYQVMKTSTLKKRGQQYDLFIMRKIMAG